MFSVGDYVVYGTSGVCKVEAVGERTDMGMPKDKKFYTLVPVYSKESKVFTPVDNKKVVIRPVITKDEADLLIKKIPQVETNWIPDDKKREACYKECLKNCNILEWIKVLKTLRQRIQKRIAEGKKVTAGDERHLKSAEEAVFGELSIALQIPKDSVEQYISEKLAG